MSRQLYYVPTSRTGGDRRRRNHHHRGQAHGGGYVRAQQQPQQRQGGDGGQYRARHRPNLGTEQKDIAHHRDRSGARRPPVPPATRGAPNNNYLPASNVPPGPTSGSAGQEPLPTYPVERNPPSSSSETTATAVINRDPPAPKVNAATAPMETRQQQQREGLHVTRWSLSRVVGITVGASVFSLYGLLLFFAYRRRRRHGPIIKGDNDNDSDKWTEEVSSTKSSSKKSVKKEDEDIQRAIATTEAMLSMGSSSLSGSGSKESRTKEEKTEEGAALDLAIKQANERSLSAKSRPASTTKDAGGTPDDMLLKHQLPSGSPEDETRKSTTSPMMDSIRDLLKSTNDFVTGDLSVIQEAPSGAETATAADAEDNVAKDTWDLVAQVTLPPPSKPDTPTPLYVKTSRKDVESDISSLEKSFTHVDSHVLHRLPVAASSRSYRKTSNKRLVRSVESSDLSTGNFFTIGKPPTAPLRSSRTDLEDDDDDDDDFVEEPGRVSTHDFCRDDEGEEVSYDDAATLESSDRGWMSNLRFW